MNDKTISAEELLEITLERLSKIIPSEEIIFPGRVSVIIADDSDAHRIRQGYMGYKKARMFRFNEGKTWTISIGKAWGDYPAKPYNSDIIAIEISPEKRSREEIIKEIQETIHLGQGFLYSLIIARQNGKITIARNPENRFGKKILEQLRPIASKFITQRLEVDDKYISASDLLPVVKSPVRYKPEFADELAKTISEILAK